VIWNSWQRAKHEQVDYDRKSYTAYYDSYDSHIPPHVDQGGLQQFKPGISKRMF